MRAATAGRSVNDDQQEAKRPGGTARSKRTGRKPRSPDLGRDRKEAGIEQDARLAQRCVAGEVAAWEELYAMCHDALLVSVRILLGRHAHDRNLVEEIAARVWYAVVENDGELLARYDPSRGARLITFLRTLAKDEIGRHFRTEIRRREHLLAALRERPHVRLSDPPHDESLDEFLGTLTPHERTFCSQYLLSQADEADPNRPSLANIWQLSRRVYQKLLRFVDRGK